MSQLSQNDSGHKFSLTPVPEQQVLNVHGSISFLSEQNNDLGWKVAVE